MTAAELETTGASPDEAKFKTTHWSAVLSAGKDEGEQGRKALAKLCQTYWYPLYVFVRRQGQNADDAKDLVQGFFAKVLEKNYIKDAVPEKGRFRSFLLLALKRYMANEWDRANRQKRGGGVETISLDANETETRYQAEPVDTMSPEKVYERRWAQTLLGQVLQRLESEFKALGKEETYQGLKAFLNTEGHQRSYAEVGRDLGMNEGAVKVAVHRLRQRYRELLRSEIANTVADPALVDEEIRHLFLAFA
jgi:RNA polymerase sigma-70 factor (ECF subfamily)